MDAHPNTFADDDRDGVSEPVPSGRSDATRQALRGSLGCEHAALLSLTSEERQRCQDRLAAGIRGTAAPKLDLGRRGAFATDREPYLARKPKNGCKPRAGGDATPSGDEGAAAGVGCAWSF